MVHVTIQKIEEKFPSQRADHLQKHPTENFCFYSWYAWSCGGHNSTEASMSIYTYICICLKFHKSTNAVTIHNAAVVGNWPENSLRFPADNNLLQYVRYYDHSNSNSGLCWSRKPNPDIQVKGWSTFGSSRLYRSRRLGSVTLSYCEFSHSPWYWNSNKAHMAS